MTKSWMCILAIAALLMDAGPAVFAHPPGAPAPSIAAQIHQLQSTRWQVRHAAEHALLMAPTGAITPVTEAYIRTGNPELSARLRRIGLQLYLEREISDRGVRPFLGIEFIVIGRRSGTLSFSAIYAVKVLRGFPAGRKLRHGDMIIGVNGRYFGPSMTANDFLRLMMSFRAGTRVVLRVLKAGRIHSCSIRLRLIGVPAIDEALAELLAARAAIIRRYLRYLDSLQGQIWENHPPPAESPIVFFHSGKGPKS
ncbi:MAG: hypothetical protein ACP5O1_09950 [Phycisphaerae bacterium]